jgi:hypothetical protein
VKSSVHVAHGLALALVVGCGGPPPAQPARQEVVVAGEDQVPEEDAPETSDSSAPAPARTGGDVEACVRGLRDGEGVSNAEGRTFYDAGLSAERANDLMTARRSYYELIQKHPRSGLIPLAYLAFGEVFFAEAKSDPSKYPLSEQAYMEVARYPPPDNTAYAYAWLRIGDVHTATADAMRALSDYKKAVEAAKQFPNLPCSQVIGDGAKEKLAKAFADSGDPGKAYVFFKAIVGDEGAKKMMEQLVAVYRDQKKPTEACSAVRSTPSLADLVPEFCKKP